MDSCQEVKYQFGFLDDFRMSKIWDKAGIIGVVYNGTNILYVHNLLYFNDIDYIFVKIITFSYRGVAVKRHP